MLNESKPITGEKMIGKSMPWIIDMGASNYTASRIEDFYDLKEVTQCPVGYQMEATSIPSKKDPLSLIGILS